MTPLPRRPAAAEPRGSPDVVLEASSTPDAGARWRARTGPVLAVGIVAIAFPGLRRRRRPNRGRSWHARYSRTPGGQDMENEGTTARTHMASEGEEGR